MSKKTNKKIVTLLAVSTLACAGFGVGAVNAPVSASADGTIAMVTGASVRLADDFYGLRFKMAVSSAYYAENAAGAYGMAIIPEDYLTTYAEQLTAGGNDYVTVFSSIKNGEENIPFLNITNMQGYSADASYEATEGEGSYVCFNGVIASIKYENLDREFIGIGYYYDGTSYEYATFTTEDNARSVVEVAQKAINDNAVATTDIYTADQVLRLYEYTFLNEQKANDVNAEDAAEAYTQYQAGLATQYVSTETGTYRYVHVAQKDGVDMVQGDTLTVSYDIKDIELTSDNPYWFGFTIGDTHTTWDDAYPYISGTLVTPHVYVGTDKTWRLWTNGDNIVQKAEGGELVGVRADGYASNVIYADYSPVTLLQAGRSVKIVYKPWYSAEDQGTIDIYTKTIAETEWQLMVAYSGVPEESAPKDDIRISLSGGHIQNVVLDNYKSVHTSGASETTYTELQGWKCVPVKGNVVTVDLDGAISTAFVSVGKAYAPAGAENVEWTIDGVAYDATAPIFNPITITGETPVPEVVAYAKYSADMTSTGAEMYITNLIPLKKGQDFSIYYTYGDANYTAATGGVLWAITANDNPNMAFGQTKGHYVINNGDDQVYWTKAGNKILYEFKYNAANDNYNVGVYLDSNGAGWGGTGISFTLPASEYFGINFIRINGSIPLTELGCYAGSEHPGMQGNAQVALTPIA